MFQECVKQWLVNDILALMNKVEKLVESLCGQGCSAVNHMIEIAENGKMLEEFQELSPTSQQEVISELKSIMQVYETSD